MNRREKIINAAIDEFVDKGLKFTMDDVAKRLYMSKKTLYTVFKDKEEMLLALPFCIRPVTFVRPSMYGSVSSSPVSV